MGLRCSAAGQARRRFEETFTYELADSGHGMFFATDRHGAYTSADLAAVCLGYVVDVSRSKLLGWLR